MDALERKTVTVVFADIVESTPLGERLDPEALRGVIDRRSGEMLKRSCGPQCVAKVT